ATTPPDVGTTTPLDVETTTPFPCVDEFGEYLAHLQELKNSTTDATTLELLELELLIAQVIAINEMTIELDLPFPCLSIIDPRRKRSANLKEINYDLSSMAEDKDIPNLQNEHITGYRNLERRHLSDSNKSQVFTCTEDISGNLNETIAQLLDNVDHAYTTGNLEEIKCVTTYIRDLTQRVAADESLLSDNIRGQLLNLTKHLLTKITEFEGSLINI
ncbi:unnamed protein product, partial [Meganyctiphanes norvegica]